NLCDLGAEATVRRPYALADLRDGEDGPFDLGFVDPPHDAAPRLARPLADDLPRIPSGGGRIVTESDTPNPLNIDMPLLREREQGASAIVKGLRAISDFEYEFEMNQLNRKMDPEIESVYLMAAPQFSFLSSRGIKELAMFGGDISGLVPDRVSARLEEELKRERN